MHIGIPQETRAGEARVAATPETVKKYVAQGHQVTVQAGAGVRASIPDAAFEAAGARIGTAADAFGAELVLKVRAPDDAERAQIKPGAVLVGMLNPFDIENNARMASAAITAFALEAAPRTTRAQSMDVLSSQANIAGYKAVLVAAHHYQRFMPMLMTAAGTVKAARVLIMGVGGYARPMPADWMRRQAELVHQRATQADIVITTALIPGRKAPVLLQEDTVRQMKPGSVVVDLAAAQGGNCPLTVADEVVERHGVVLIGYTNLAGMVAADASALYARNVLDFLKLIVDKDARYTLNLEDDIVAACLMCKDGQLVRQAA